MQLVADEEPDALEEALTCFQDAVKLDPASAEAYEELAHFLDDVADEPAEAEVFFRRAIELGAGESAHEGLRDVLSQLGRTEE
jgi:tetratricopeptide (TPR) repeat protein